MIYLKQPGEDWVLSSDEKKLFVTMPKAGQVAVADTESFKVVKNIDSGIHPVRIVLQPDRKYLWVGNDSGEKDRSGVTVIDADRLNVVTFIPTGRGHHEIAFEEDSLYAFVTNRDEGTLSILDVQRLVKIKDIKTGDRPSAVASPPLSQSVFVAHEGDGSILVLDGKRHKVIARIETKPGLKALRFAPGGRWGFAANERENLVYVFDASNNQIVHTVAVGKGPDQITFTKTYAYVRSKGAPEFTLIQLGNLGKEGPLPVLKIPGGQKAPGESSFGAVADAIFPTPEEGHALIANPADGMIYYYMEGMMASMGSFRSYGGHIPRAVRVVDRSLRETEKGVYSARIRIPASGKYQVAFLLDSPRVIHCFEFSAKPNPILAKTTKQPTIEVLTDEKKIRVGENFRLKFKVITSPQKEPIHDIKDLIVQATLASGLWWERFPAKHLGDGIYEVNFVVPRPGVLYVNFTCPSLKVDFKGFPSLIYEATSITTMKFERELGSPTTSRGGRFSKIL
jgi:YVTN family beta-propeller protein